ncbi:MAG: DMT family transporter, partial [Rhodanobacter sp.]
MSPSPSRGALSALLATILIWAYSWVVMKQVLAYAGPFHFAALRYLLGAAVLFAALLLSRQSLRPPPLLPTLLIGLCQTAAFQGLEQWALLDGGAGHVALLAYTMPFWAVLLAWLLLGDRPTARHWLGLALAAFGLLCIIEPW